MRSGSRLRPARRRPPALRALSVVAAVALAGVAVAVATGAVASGVPDHLRWTVAAVLALMSLYRLINGWRT